jgi:hypothetical protein
MKQYTFPEQTKGDTFNSRKITFPFDISNCQIKMEFKYKIGNKVAFFWSTEDDSFTNLSPNEIVMTSRILDEIPNIYVYDLQIIFPGGETKTYFGGTMKIIQDITT